ncbi:MAG: M20/M25/M40 family metallo-hydrolase [bacterium]
MEGDIIKCLGQIEEKELVEFCQNLIKIPSHKDALSREKEMALFLKDFMEREGIEVVLQEVAEGRSNVIRQLENTYAEFRAEVNPIAVGPDTREQLKEIEKQGLEIPPHEPMEISRDSKIVRALSKAFKYVRGRNPEIAGMSGWTDASLLVNRAKIPTAVFGPGPVIKAHTTEEYVNIADLVDAAKVYAVTAVEVCSLSP